MFGSGGAEDYIVVAHRGDTVVGVKLLSGVAPDGRIIVGIRFRAALVGHLPDEPTDAGQLFMKTYPDVKFTKVDADRASVVASFPLNKTVYAIHKVVENLDATDFYKKLQAFLLSFVDSADLELAFETFRDALKKQAEALFPTTDPQNEPEEGLNTVDFLANTLKLLSADAFVDVDAEDIDADAAAEYYGMN